MAPNPQNESSPLLGTSETKVSSSSALKTEAPARPSCSRSCHLLSLVTVEPALFLMALGFGMEQVFKTNMLVDKTCAIQLNYSADVCRNLDSGNYKVEQDATQKLVANYNLYCQVIELLPGALVTLLLGAWSDTRGRLLPILIPAAGATLKALGLCCNAYWWSLQPWYVLLPYIPYGLTGSMMSLFMGAYAYLSDLSSHRSRTTRLSISGMMLYVAMPLGNIMGAALYSHGGYVAVFGAEFIFCFLSLAYFLIRLKNSTPESTAAKTEERKVSPLSQLRRSLMVVAQRRAANGRARILGHVACIALYLVVSMVMFSFMFLYTRKRFMWDYKQYTIWSTVNSVASSLVACLALPLLSFRLGIEDSLLAFVGSATHAFYGVVVGTAPDPFFLFLAVVLASAGGFTISCSRGALSKLVAPNELGAVFSVVGLFESLGPVIASPLYTLVYDYTLEFYPGTVFLISAAVSLFICCIYTWLLTAFPAAASPSPVNPKQDKSDHPQA